MMSSWLCHISCDHVRPQGVGHGEEAWRGDREGADEKTRREKLREAAAHRPQLGAGGRPIQSRCCRLIW